MKRALEDTIKSCMQKAGAPLVLYGPPGVGKSYLLRNYCENEGIRSYIICDLNTDIEFRSGLLSAIDKGVGLVSYLSEFFSMDMNSVRNRLYLILDSIEVLKNKAAALFAGELPYRMAVTTSRIDWLNDYTEDGTCAVQTVFVPTFSFYEFLEAVSDIEGENYSEILRTQYMKKLALPDLIDDEVRELFHDYLMVGGYPEAIKQYIMNRTDISELYRVQEALYSTTVLRYIKDMPDNVSYVRLMQLLEYIKVYGADNRSAFHPGHIRRGAQLRDYMKELRYLFDNHVLVPIYVSGDLFRFEPADCGMLRYMLSDYDFFLKLDSSEELPEFIYQNYLYHVLHAAGGQIEAKRSGRNHYIPYYTNRCLIAYRNKDITEAGVSDSERSAYSDERLIISLTDRKKQLKNADHNIQYYFFELTQF